MFQNCFGGGKNDEYIFWKREIIELQMLAGLR